VLFARADWLACIFTLRAAEEKQKWLPVSNKVTLKKVKLLFGPLVIQLVWCIPKFTSVSMKVVDIYRAAKISTAVHLHFDE